MNTFLRIEKCLLPAPEIIRWDHGSCRVILPTTAQKVVHCTKNFFALTALTLALPLTLAYDFLTYREVAPIAVPPSNTVFTPEQRGFATSLFQTCGLGTKWSAVPDLRGRCDWDKWMDKPSHVIHPEGFDYKNFFTDILSDPAPYIAMLKSHNVTAHRFSLEWGVFEPRQGEIDEKAVALYRNFVQQLLEAGITPSVTLSHFVVPEWFYEQGNFQKLKNVDLYVRFALKALELFPEVNDWWSFNELGVKAFQQAREVYPTDLPEGSSLSARVHAAGIATRNMVIAHCKLHAAVAKLYPEKKVGVTHQWLQFDGETGNPLESLVAHLFEKFAFTPVYGFFKEGKFSFEMPFMANIQFEVPKEEFEKNGRFLMRLGVQAYPKAMVKMGLNHGEVYPGLPGNINNLPLFTFGGTCEKGGVLMRFGPRWKAERMDEILQQGFALTDEVFVTEYGSDAAVQKWGAPAFAFDDDAQAEYLRALTERISRYAVKGRFCWTDLRRQLEWENGFSCRLGTVGAIVDGARRLVGWRPTPASCFIAQANA